MVQNWNALLTADTNNVHNILSQMALSFANFMWKSTACLKECLNALPRSKFSSHNKTLMCFSLRGELHCKARIILDEYNYSFLKIPQKPHSNKVLDFLTQGLMILFMDNDQELIVTRLLVSAILVSTISNIFFLNNYPSLEEMMPKFLQVACHFKKRLSLLATLCPYQQFTALSCTQQKTVAILNPIPGNKVGDFPFNLKNLSAGFPW